jgi:GDP-mannose 6-dehydrogenase
VRVNPSPESFAPSRVSVFGLGYVGCVTAACLARLGHSVIGVDKDHYKVKNVLGGKAPFYEPGLEEMIRENVAAGRLSATTDAAEAVGSSDIALICVGTPSQENGNLSLDQLHRVVAEIRDVLSRAPKPFVAAVRSTVFPGVCDELVLPGAALVSNPEFLREGTAVADFMSPSLLVVGSSDSFAAARVAGMYAPLGVAPCLVSLRAAEFIKYACNAFHAVKIGFANEIGALSVRLGISGSEVMETLCRDTALNISTAYLKPGFAFGGSCLPKDLRALVFRAGRLDMNLPLLESALPSNEEHLRRAMRLALELPAERLGVFGLAFKENTDDLRESPVIALLEHLIGKGRPVRVFDPHIEVDQIYGSNRRFLFDAIPHIGRLVDKNLEETLAWADHLILAQRPSASYRGIIERSGKPVLDLHSAEPVAEAVCAE